MGVFLLQNMGQFLLILKLHFLRKPWSLMSVVLGLFISIAEDLRLRIYGLTKRENTGAAGLVESSQTQLAPQWHPRTVCFVVHVICDTCDIWYML